MIESGAASRDAIHGPADRATAISSCLALATVGFVTSMGMPMVVAALMQEYKYSEGQAGYVASCEYLGMFAASAVVSTLILGLSRRKLAVAGIFIAVCGNAASLLFIAPMLLLAVRFLSGLGCGMAYAVAVSILAGTRHTVRNFMYLVFANAVTNVIVLYASPPVLLQWHLGGIFAAYCAVLIATLACVPWLPTGLEKTTDAIPTERVARGNPPPPFILWVCLFAVFCFYMMIGAYWAFLVPIGVSLGFDAEFVGQMLSAGILLSLVSCLVAYRLSQRMGQSKPLLVALGVIATTQISSGILWSPAAFLICLGTVNFFWNFTDIYQFGTIANMDHSGVFAARIQGAQMLGYVISPAGAGWLLDHRLSFPILLVVLGAYVAAAFGAYVYVYTVLRRKDPILPDRM